MTRPPSGSPINHWPPYEILVQRLAPRLQTSDQLSVLAVLALLLAHLLQFRIHIVDAGVEILDQTSLHLDPDIGIALENLSPDLLT